MGTSFSRADIATRQLLPTYHPAFDRVRELYETLFDIEKEAKRYTNRLGRVEWYSLEDPCSVELVANVDNIVKIMREASL